jgi:hypothetical protein
MYTSKITHNKPILTWVKKKLLRHIAGNIMTSIETKNTSNKIPRQYRYQ